MVKDYEKSRGKTIEFILDQSDDYHEEIKFQFTDGSSLIICGNFSGNELEWYEGLYHKFEDKRSY